MIQFTEDSNLGQEVRTAATFEEVGVILLQRWQKEVRSAARCHRFCFSTAGDAATAFSTVTY